jgi:hypothetical protein
MADFVRRLVGTADGRRMPQRLFGRRSTPDDARANPFQAWLYPENFGNFISNGAIQQS